MTIAPDDIQREGDFYRLFLRAPQPMWVCDRATLAILEVNHAAVATYGYSRDGFLALRLTDLYPAEDVAALLMSPRQPGGLPAEQRHRHQDGAALAVEATISALEFGGRPALLCINRAITETSPAMQAQQRLSRQNALILNSAGNGIFGLDGEGRTTFANPAVEAMTGYTAQEMIGQVQHALVHHSYPDGRPYPREDCPIYAALRDGAVHRVADEVFWRKDGSPLPVEYVSTPIVENGEVIGAVVAITDITERKRTEQALGTSEALFRVLTEHGSDLVTIVNADGTIRYASPSFQRILGYAPEQMVGHGMLELVHPDDVADQVGPRLAARLRTPGLGTPVEFRARHADGSWRTIEAVGNNMLDDPVAQGIIINARDVTERARMEEDLRHQTLHDTLTGLPNRTLLDDRLSQALLSATRAGSTLALLLLDLDRFKEINDTFGHHRGDQVLRLVAARLRATLRASDTLARLGGDEFAIVLPAQDERGAEHSARRVVTALEEPIEAEGSFFQLEVSIGIAVGPQHGGEPDTLLRRADVAMYVAKKAGGGWAFYAAEHDAYSPQRLALIADLRQAIAHDALRLHYQPKIDLASGHVIAAEALARWDHPQQGVISPDSFITLAENVSLMGPLTMCVLRLALRQCAQWHAEGLPLGVAVNLSMANLRDPRFVPQFLDLLVESGVPPAALTLEITESTVMDDVTRLLGVLQALSASGARLSIDDFGTGYSSLSRLQRLPVQELKIDQSFVLHMAEDETDRTIVAAIITLGHTLGLRVVAEGVEDQQSCDQLTALGCDEIQGYLVSRPLPPEGLAAWLTTSPWAAPGQPT